MLTVLVAGSSNIIYPVCTLWPPYPWPSSEIGSCELGELGLHLGQKTWAGGAQDFYPSALQSSNPKPQSLGEFLKSTSLSCQCWSSHESTADLSLCDANVGMHKSSFACFRRSIIRFKQTEILRHFFFLSCFGDSIRKIRCNNSSYLLVFTISR